jgi:hypothetical protein
MTRLKILLLSITLAITFNVLSQNNTSPAKADTANYPYWIEMMQDESVNFYDVQRAFNIYWEGREITKGSGWKPFKRWEWWMEIIYILMEQESQQIKLIMSMLNI